MEAGLLLQYLAVAALALASLWVVMTRQFPNAMRRLRTACALPMLREGRPAWVRALGRRLAPPGRAGSAGACGGCDSCGSTGRR